MNTTILIIVYLSAGYGVALWHWKNQGVKITRDELLGVFSCMVVWPAIPMGFAFDYLGEKIAQFSNWVIGLGDED